jgi:hypothetical protein
MLVTLQILAEDRIGRREGQSTTSVTTRPWLVVMVWR